MAFGSRSGTTSGHLTAVTNIRSSLLSLELTRTVDFTLPSARVVTFKEGLAPIEARSALNKAFNAFKSCITHTEGVSVGVNAVDSLSTVLWVTLDGSVPFSGLVADEHAITKKRQLIIAHTASSLAGWHSKTSLGAIGFSSNR